MIGSFPRIGALCVLAFGLPGCALPRSGPSPSEIAGLSAAAQAAGGSILVMVDEGVTEKSRLVERLGFPKSFRAMATLGPDTISEGDTLGLTIYENVDNGLLASQGGKASKLAEVQVDATGHIFIPYAGRISAVGLTPEELRARITERLNVQTPDPQVLVARKAGDGATVSVMGGVGAQGVYPIERPTRALSAMLAAAGGVTVPPEIAQVTVIRGGERGKVWFENLFEDPASDIALRGGDRILVEEDTRSFTALGATGKQSRVRFDSQELSAIEALALAGGLNAAVAAPTGIFVFRKEPTQIARAVTGRQELADAQRIVYAIDLTAPDGMFRAREFLIRDDDTVYITEAPFVRWQKVLSAVTGASSGLSSVQTLANNP